MRCGGALGRNSIHKSRKNGLKPAYVWETQNGIIRQSGRNSNTTSQRKKMKEKAVATIKKITE